MKIDASIRAHLAILAQQPRSSIGRGTGKRERSVLKVAKAIEELIQ